MNLNYSLTSQNWMWAVRREMGWPAEKPACDSIAWAAGRLFDIELGLDLARHTQTLRKDIVYGGWPKADARAPFNYTVALRELMTVDLVTRLIPYAADETTPVVLVSTRSNEHFTIGSRGLLERHPGKPCGLARGRALATKRIRRTAASMGDEICPDNLWIRNGEDVVEPAPTAQGIVARFN